MKTWRSSLCCKRRQTKMKKPCNHTTIVTLLLAFVFLAINPELSNGEIHPNNRLPPPRSSRRPFTFKHSKSNNRNLLSSTRPPPSPPRAASAVTTSWKGIQQLTTHPPMIVKAAAAAFPIFLISYTLYNIGIRKILQTRFLRLQLLAAAAKIAADDEDNEDGDSSTNKHDDDDDEDVVLVEEALRKLLSKFVPCKNMNYQQDDHLVTIWKGPFSQQQKQHNDNTTAASTAMPTQLLDDGWYSIGSGGGSGSNLIVIQLEQEQATISLVVDDSKKKQHQRLFGMGFQELMTRRRQEVGIAENLHERMAWQTWLKKKLVLVLESQEQSKEDDNKLASNVLSPGKYIFLYREYVNEEEFLVMLSKRGAWTSLKLTKPSSFVIEEEEEQQQYKTDDNDDNGDQRPLHCYLEDHGKLYGFLPVRTHNCGRIVRSNKGFQIEWESSSVRIGWNHIGKTMEIAAVTKILKAAPWPLFSVLEEEEEEEGGSSCNTEVLLMNRPKNGWLIWYQG